MLLLKITIITQEKIIKIFKTHFSLLSIAYENLY